MKTEIQIRNEAGQALRRCLADVPFVQIENTEIEPSVYGRPDMLVRLKLPSGEITLVLETKASGQPRFAREAVGQIERLVSEIPNSYGVFVAPYISPRASDICVQRNIGYMDLAGNCRLSFWPVYIKTVSGINPFAERRELRSLYSPKSIKTTTILRVILKNPKRVWRMQELADEAGASLGQVASVKKQLEDREWIESETGGFRLTDAVALLSDWSSNYDTRLNSIRDFYSMKSIPEIEAELGEFCSREGIEYALTGFSGGARYAPSVRYQRATAYIYDDAIDRVAEALNLKEVPSGANISLISPYDRSVFYGTSPVDGVCVVSSTQAYLDLRSQRARGEEAAEALLKGTIEPKWR